MRSPVPSQTVAHWESPEPSMFTISASSYGDM